MKYNRKKLIDKAKAKIKALDKVCEAERAKGVEELQSFKQRALVAAELYLKQLKEWEAKPNSSAPSLQSTYGASWRPNSGPEMQRAELQRFIAQLELSDENTIVFKTQYDMQLLNSICQ